MRIYNFRKEKGRSDVFPLPIEFARYCATEDRTERRTKNAKQKRVRV